MNFLDNLLIKLKKSPKENKANGIQRKNKRAGWMIPDALAIKLFSLERKKFYRRIQIMARAQLPFSEAIEELRSRAFESKSGVMFAMPVVSFKSAPVLMFPVIKSSVRSPVIESARMAFLSPSEKADIFIRFYIQINMFHFYSRSVFNII